MNSRKQESGDGHDNNNSKLFSKTKTMTTTTTPSSSSSRQSWAGFKNPRIVRVSRAFGGKDRHSKVCTVKGLRDRRIRLSVPTAIQLYDLQDRLGLSQPSKVVDWLIDASKQDIDKLPPLQMPPSSLSHLFNMKDHVPNHHQDFVDATLREKWIATTNEQQESTHHDIFQSSTLPAGMLNSNNIMAFNNINNALMSHNWEPNPNLSLGPFGNYNHTFPSSQTDHHHQECHQQNMSFPSASQLYFCPTTAAATTLSSIVPPYNSHLNLFNPNALMPTLQLISTPVKSPFNKGLNLQESDHDHHENHKEGSG